MGAKGAVVGAGCVLALLSAATVAPRAQGADADEAAIKSRALEFAAAWNKHDPKAMAAFWAEDGDLVSPDGRHAVGRAEVERLFADEQGSAGPFRESTLEVKGDSVRLVTPEVAVLDWDVVVSRAYGPDGTKAGPRAFLVPVVLRKTGAAWQAFAARPHSKAVPAGATAPPATPAAPGPKAAPNGTPSSEPISPEIVREVMDGLQAAKVSGKWHTQPAIDVIRNVATAAGVQVFFSPAGERSATSAQVEMVYDREDAEQVFRLLAGAAHLSWSVAGKGAVRFVDADEK